MIVWQSLLNRFEYGIRYSIWKIIWKLVSIPSVIFWQTIKREAEWSLKDTGWAKRTVDCGVTVTDSHCRVWSGVELNYRYVQWFEVSHSGTCPYLIDMTSSAVLRALLRESRQTTATKTLKQLFLAYFFQRLESKYSVENNIRLLCWQFAKLLHKPASTVIFLFVCCHLTSLFVQLL